MFLLADSMAPYSTRGGGTACRPDLACAHALNQSCSVAPLVCHPRGTTTCSPRPTPLACSYESGFSDAANAEEASVALQITLPCMRHLTCLVLSSAAIDQDVLAAVAAMPSLLRLYASAEWAVLPAGPWQARLRWLALGHRALLASVDELATAAALEYVNILSVSGWLAGGW